jgi:hypothetical protein
MFAVCHTDLQILQPREAFQESLPLTSQGRSLLLHSPGGSRHEIRGRREPLLHCRICSDAKTRRVAGLFSIRSEIVRWYFVGMESA